MLSEIQSMEVESDDNLCNEVIAVTIIDDDWLVKAFTKVRLAPKQYMLGTYKKLHKNRSLRVNFWFKSQWRAMFFSGVTRFGNLYVGNWCVTL